MSYVKRKTAGISALIIFFIFGLSPPEFFAQTGDLPDPPQLLSPRTGEEVTGDEIVFFWTAAVKLPGRGIIYEFMIVPVNRGQEPGEAFAENDALHRNRMRRTFYQYPLKDHPLKAGQEYAWRIRVVDEEDKAISSNDGYTGIYTLVWNAPEAAEPEITPVHKRVRTEKIVMTGMRYRPLNIRTDRITMMGLRTEELPIVTDKIRMTGMRYAPLAVRTEKIQMTGMRYDSKHIVTDAIKMVGLRGYHIVVPTDTIRMTGWRVDEERLVEWWGQSIDGLQAILDQFVEEARAFREAAAAEKLNEAVTLVGELHQQAAAGQAELQNRIGEIQGAIQGLQTAYTGVTTAETTPAEHEQALAGIMQQTQNISGELAQTKNQLGVMIK